MKQPRLIAVIALLTLIALFPAASAVWSKPQRYVSSFQGRTASIQSSTYDSTTSIYTDLYLTATESTTTNSAYPGPGESINVSLLFQRVTFTEYGYQYLVSSYYSGPLPNGRLTISANGKSATLQTTIEMFDYINNAPITAVINLTWSSTGELIQMSSSYRTASDSYLYLDRTRGRARDATTTGSVIIGGASILENGSTQGSIYANSTRQVTIIR